MGVFTKKGFMVGCNGSCGSGGDGVSDIVNGFAILKENQVANSGVSISRATVFNLNREKFLTYTTINVIGQGENALKINQTSADDITVDTSVSTINLAFGQNYSTQIKLQDIVTVAADDSFLLLPGVNNNTNIYRVGFNPQTYQFTNIVSVDTGIASPKKVEIIDANSYVNYNGQNLQIFTFDGTAITLTKTIALSFDIVRVSAVNGLIVAIGLNDIVFIDPSTENIVYTETTQAALTLADVYCIENYAFVKTLSSTDTPILAYSVTNNSIVKLQLSLDGEMLSGGIKSLINVIKEDNVPGNYAMVYHSDNVSNLALHIDINSGRVKVVDVGADVITGTPASVKPTFLTGNRIIYTSSTSGTPGDNYLAVYKYEYTEISHRRNGKMFKIDGLG